MSYKNSRSAWRLSVYTIAIFLVFLFTALAIVRVHGEDKKPQVSPASVSTCQPDASQLLTLVNQERSKLGAPMLTTDIALATSARNKLDGEISGQYYGHNLADGTNDVSILRAQGVNAASSEDLDSNAINPDSDWNSFKNSPAHYASLTNPQYVRVGIASQCTDFTLQKETDTTGNLPIGTQIKELTVVYLAAPEPPKAAPQATQQTVYPKVTTCYPASSGVPAMCITR